MKKKAALLCILLAFTLLAGTVLPISCGSIATAEGAETGANLLETPSTGENGNNEQFALQEGETDPGEKSTKKLVMRNGQTLQLTVKTGKKIKWSSSNKKIATVSSKGLVKAKKVGTVTITAKYGSKTRKFSITVKVPVTASSKDIKLKELNNKAITLKCWLEYTSLSYNIADPSIVSAAWAEEWDGWNNGYNQIKLYLTGLKAGSTRITITNTKTKDKIVLKVKVTAQSAANTKYRALLIGNSNYSVGNRLPNHKWDVTAMKGLLTSSLTTKYSVTTKLDCTASSILKAIPAALGSATNNDVSLFYYAGHGVANSGALHCVNGSQVSPAELSKALQNIKGRVIVILECCHSGAYITNGNNGGSQQDPAKFNKAVISAFANHLTSSDDETAKSGELMMPKFIVLTACTMYEESWNWWYDEGGGWEDQSFGTFTKALFNGLGCKWSSGVYSGSAPCDTNKDGKASLGECKKYVGQWANRINEDMGGNNVQSCMSYGDANYPLFSLKN